MWGDGLASALCGEGVCAPLPHGGGLGGPWAYSRKADTTGLFVLAGPPWLLKAAWGPRVGGCALLCPLVCPCWGVCTQPGPCRSQLLGLRYATPPATSHLCLGFWGGSLVCPGRCPRPSYGLCSLGVPQLLATREPWRVKKTQPRPVGPRTVAVFVLGLSLRPVPAACCKCHSGGAGMSDPAFKGSPEQKMGRVASWRSRLGLGERWHQLRSCLVPAPCPGCRVVSGLP